MASIQTLEEHAKCPICSGPYKEARKLPGCTHSFCETCILTYVLNLQKDAKLERFQCPVCRLPSDVSEDGYVTLEWIQTMEKINTPSMKIEANELNEIDLESCSQCSYLEKHTHSKYYCVDCREKFCEMCSRAFHSFKMTINHVLIDVESDKENTNVHEHAVAMLAKFLACSKHSKQPVAFYCESEKQFFCCLCAVNKHQNCTKMNTAEFAKTYEKNMSKKVVSSCKRLLSHTQSVITLIKEHDKETKSGRFTLLDEFLMLKQKVVDQFEILEESLKADSKALCKEIAIKNLDELDELKDVASKLTVIVYLIESLADKIPDELSLICVYEANNILKHIKEATVERGPSRDNTSLILKTESMLRDLINIGPNETNRIASVQMVKENVLLPDYDEELCLRKCNVRRINTSEIIGDYCNGLNPKYSGVVFLRDNKMVLSDMFFGYVCLADANSKLLSSMNCVGDNKTNQNSMYNVNMICVTVLANSNIAVGMFDTKQIYFLSAYDTLEYWGHTICQYRPKAIHGLRNGDIAVLWNSPWAFGIITPTAGPYNERVYFNKDNNQRKLNSNGFMAVDESRGHVILPGKRDRTIYCYDFEGNEVFATHDVKIAAPTGVAVDGDGNIYVCEQKHGAIIVLSPAGILIRMIEDECPTEPLGIGFKEDGKTLKFCCYPVLAKVRRSTLLILNSVVNRIFHSVITILTHARIQRGGGGQRVRLPPEK